MHPGHLGRLDSGSGGKWREGHRDLTNVHGECRRSGDVRHRRADAAAVQRAERRKVADLKKRLSKGLGDVNEKLDAHAERLELLTRSQTESELRLASEVLSLADVTREVRDLISRKLDDHKMVLEHEDRLRSLEDRIADR